MKKEIYQFGVAYYPDYIESQSWLLNKNKACEEPIDKRMSADFVRMVNAGVREIRIGEFSWATVEPKEHEFRSEPFDLCLEYALKSQIDVIFSTPTATPPKWLVDRYPDMLPKNHQGQQVHWGSRRHYDPLHPAYIDHTKRITEYFAKTWGNHPAVKGWQIDNELGHHGSSQLFTEHSRTNFQDFLKKKYTTIASLNKNWFTCFWSQNYLTFDEIELPLATWADINPHLQADFKDFCTRVFKDYQKIQIDIIRPLSPGRYITHNLISNFYDLCPWEMTKDLDIVGFDHYQDDPYPNPIRSTVNFSLMHGIGNGRPFKILEQQPVQVNWQMINRRFSLDWLLLWAAQSACLGAKSMDYFSFQKFYGGAEQYHDGLIPHDLRNPQSQQERMMKSSCEMFANLAEKFQISELPKRETPVWIVHNTKSLWSHRICSQSTYYDAVYQLDDLAKLLTGLGIGFKYIESIPQTLTDCQMLILPGYAFETSSVEQEILRHFIEAGGILWTLPRTSMKQMNHHMSPLPLSVIDSSGLYFEDFGALGAEELEDIDCGNNQKIQGYRWAEKICITDSSVYSVSGKFSGGLYHDWPSIIERQIGKGKHVHFAFCPVINQDFQNWVIQNQFLSPVISTTQRDKLGNELQIFPLKAIDRKFLGIVNFGTESFSFKLSESKIRSSLACNVDELCHLKTHFTNTPQPDKMSVNPRSILWLELI